MLRICDEGSVWTFCVATIVWSLCIQKNTDKSAEELFDVLQKNYHFA